MGVSTHDSASGEELIIERTEDYRRLDVFDEIDGVLTQVAGQEGG
jgi:hypothetical protein